MKKYLSISKTILTFLIVASLASCNSCDKVDPDEKPNLPPQESLFMDFSDFNERPDEKGTTYNNFVYSFLNVAFWNTLGTVTLAPPAVAYVSILQQNARYLGDNSWEWVAYFTYNQTNYVGTLTTLRLDNETYSVELVVAPESNPDSEFKWVDGVVRYDLTSASYNIYINPGNPVKALEVDWVNEDNTSSLTYTYTVPGETETGSSINYSVDPSLTYDASYTINLSGETIEIEWDRASKAGRVRNEDYFLDNEWHCWDSNLVDIDCPG